MNFLIQKGSIEDIIICEKGGRSVNFICNLLQHPISLLLCPQPRQTEFSQLFADFQLANLQHKYHYTLWGLNSRLFRLKQKLFLTCLTELGSNQSLVLALVCWKLLTWITVSRPVPICYEYLLLKAQSVLIKKIPFYLPSGCSIVVHHPRSCFPLHYITRGRAIFLLYKKPDILIYFTHSPPSLNWAPPVNIKNLKWSAFCNLASPQCIFIASSAETSSHNYRADLTAGKPWFIYYLCKVTQCLQRSRLEISAASTELKCNTKI